ncbi:MAG: CvpA family protein [Clostridia bacterium]|nr:CvpA family protein [Clostridia bacterium]MBQ6326675.1 CvpA family protein [Clostridia bacterium]MBQ9040736.1 CvpA family protein [Clostridia bacterium]
MNLNLLDITIIVILAFYLISGMYRGFITSLLTTIGFVGAWFGAQHFYPKVAQLALSNQTLMAVLNQYLEPETFFESHTQAVSTVSEVIAGGESAIQSAVASVSNKLAVISKAFEANIRAQMFQRLGINTLADYLDQTIWQAVFNVLAFLLCFIALYVLVCLVVNLLDHVISFPMVRGFDWLLGGLFGLARGLVVVVLVLCLVPAIVQIVSPEFADSLRTGSVLYSYVMQMDFLNVNKLVTSLVGG